MSDLKTEDSLPQDELAAAMSIEAFCRDEKAVLAWREFLHSAAGRKLRRVVDGLNPLLKLASQEANNPAIIRAAAKAESESAETLLGKATGFQLVHNVLFQLLLHIHRGAPPSSSRRGGKREIPSHPTSLP